MSSETYYCSDQESMSRISSSGHQPASRLPKISHHFCFSKHLIFLLSAPQSELRVRHRDECKTVTRLTMENVSFWCSLTFGAENSHRHAFALSDELGITLSGSYLSCGQAEKRTSYESTIIGNGVTETAVSGSSQGRGFFFSVVHGGPHYGLLHGFGGSIRKQQ